MNELIIVGVCLFLNALFAAYEMAFVSVARPDLRNLSRKGNKAAARLVQLREHPERTLSIIQIGITLVGAVAAAVGGAGASEILQPYFVIELGMSQINAVVLSVVLVVLPITYLSVVIGELVPKSLALRNPLKIVMAGANALFIADRFLSPMVTALEWSTKKILNIFFRRSKAAEATSQSTIEIDGLSPSHQNLLLNLASIEQKKIKDIMVPWSLVISVKMSDSIEEVALAVLNSGHTRLPVTEDGQVKGVLHTKEFLALKESGEKNWQVIIRQPLRVLLSHSALGTLRTMQDKRNHMTVVFSPTGTQLGIVTLEDILEEVVGEIYDEDDDGQVRKIFSSRAKSRGLLKP